MMGVGSDMRYAKNSGTPDQRNEGGLTLSDSLHLWLQQDLLLEVDDLALISLYDLKRRIDNWRQV